MLYQLVLLNADGAECGGQMLVPTWQYCLQAMQTPQHRAENPVANVNEKPGFVSLC
jgi:hypothetical protein